MKILKYFKKIGLGILLIYCGCNQIDKDENLVLFTMVPFFDLGDTLRNSRLTNSTHMSAFLDSNSLFEFKFSSIHNSSMEVESYFFKFELDTISSIRILDSLATGGIVFKGPLISTFLKGDSIDFQISNDGIFDWFPKNVFQYNNTGWLKYHIYTKYQGKKIENTHLGENYIVFKFGDLGQERLGWLNLVYQDSLMYVKEAYYRLEPQREIVVGLK